MDARDAREMAPRGQATAGSSLFHVQNVAYVWHNCGVPRVRISTTVDEELLARARGVKGGAPDSALIDDALAALLARHRAAELDAAYAAYDEHPLTEDDEWGDLATFRAVTGAL